MEPSTASITASSWCRHRRVHRQRHAARVHIDMLLCDCTDGFLCEPCAAPTVGPLAST